MNIIYGGVINKLRLLADDLCGCDDINELKYKVREELYDIIQNLYHGIPLQNKNKEGKTKCQSMSSSATSVGKNLKLW